MFQKVWSNESAVHKDGTIIFNWDHAPNEEHALIKNKVLILMFNNIVTGYIAFNSLLIGNKME